MVAVGTLGLVEVPLIELEVFAGTVVPGWTPLVVVCCRVALEVEVVGSSQTVEDAAGKAWYLAVDALAGLEPDPVGQEEPAGRSGLE